MARHNEGAEHLEAATLHSMPDRIDVFSDFFAQNHLKAYHNPAQLCQIVFLGASSQCSPATVMRTLETIFIHNMLNASGNKPATPLTTAPSSLYPYYYYWKVESLVISEQKTYTPKKLTWNLKIIPLNRKLILQVIIFGVHVSFQGCTCMTCTPALHSTPCSCQI